jgi:dihydrofolate reductase
MNMRKVILVEWLSLDGYVADRNGNLDLFTSSTPAQNLQADRDQLKVLESVDTILKGRKTYELFVDYWPKATTATELIADRLNETHMIVFSTTLTHAPWGRWQDAEIISGDPVETIEALKAKPGKNMVMWGSITLAQSLMKAHLIDEYHFQICPVITGGGRSLFTQQEDFTELQLIDSTPYDTGNIFLRYKPK